MTIMAPVSAGELVDKITILRLKADRIREPAKAANVRRELSMLEGVASRELPANGALEALIDELSQVNAVLWEIEDAKRDCERRQDFGPRFVELARKVYLENDRRAEIKRRINAVTGSAIVEEKSYRPERPKPRLVTDPGTLPAASAGRR